MESHKTLTRTSLEKEAGILQLCWYDPVQDVYVAKVLYEKVKVDPSYGRDHDKNHSDSMVATEVRVTPYPIVNLRESGELYVPDGQHRKWAEVKKGRKSGYVILTIGLTKEQEAALYCGTNRAKAQTLWQRVKAGCVAGFENYTRIMSKVKAKGFTTPITKMNSGRADLTSASVLLYADGHDFLDNYLEIMTCFKVEGSLHKGVRGNIEFQRGVIELLKMCGVLGRKSLAAFKRIGASRIIEVADEFCTCNRTTAANFKCTCLNF